MPTNFQRPPAEGMEVGDFRIHIVGLSNKLHQFEYEFGDEFFRQYGTGVVSSGRFRAEVSLDKHETFIEANFSIKGTVTLICDRSLEPFDYPIWTKKRVLFKYGDTDEEISDEIVMINRDTFALELGQYVYEFIALSVPMKKLHPRFAAEESLETGNEEGKIVYRSGNEGESDQGNDDEQIDPRWNILKKLK